MTSEPENPQSPATDNPLNEFSGCHEGIIQNFHQLQDLLALTSEDDKSGQIQKLARKLLAFFEEVVLEHHAEEEQELFTAVMDSAEHGEEADQARQYIKQLVAEHRELEGMWKAIEADIKLLAKGKPAQLDRDLAATLAQKYLAHAEFEERTFLPFSAQVLSKNDMSALGLSLHMRHQESKSSNFII